MTGRQGRSSGRGKFLTPTTGLLVVAGILVALTAWLSLRPAGKPTNTTTPESDTDLAAKVLESAAKLVEPRDDQAQEQIACTQARDLMLAYVQRRRDDVLIRPLLARTLMRLGQYPDAESACDELFRRGIFDARLLMIKGVCVRQRKGEHAMSFFQRAIENKGPDAEVQTEYALEALASGTTRQKEQAQTCLAEALSDGTLRTERWVELGLRLARAGEPKGYAYLEKGLAAGSKGPMVLARQGLYLLHNGQEAWGRKYLTAARQGGVGGPEFFRAWGLAELQVNNVEPGQALIRESLAIRPDQRECYDLLARSATGEDAPVQAETILLRGVAACAKPDDQAWLLVRVGENRERRNVYRDAAEAYATAAQSDSQRLVGAKGAARCYLKLARVDDAARWATVAAEAAPDDAEVRQIKTQIDQAREGAK